MHTRKHGERIEGDVGAGVAAQERLHRLLDGFEERVREPRGNRHPERVAVESAVLGGDPTLLSRDADADRAALVRSMMRRPGKRSETKKAKQYYWRPLPKISRWDAEDEL